MIPHLGVEPWLQFLSPVHYRYLNHIKGQQINRISTVGILISIRWHLYTEWNFFLIYIAIFVAQRHSETYSICGTVPQDLSANTHLILLYAQIEFSFGVSLQLA